jgi:hypothetical protein
MSNHPELINLATTDMEITLKQRMGYTEQAATCANCEHSRFYERDGRDYDAEGYYCFRNPAATFQVTEYSSCRFHEMEKP